MSETERSATTSSSSSSSSSSSRVINLLCPSISKKKIVELMVWDDHMLDLGLISRTFGLDPASLKVNKHLITKGVDLISTSITWRSLLSFFASRGFPTGLNHYSPLIVDGKLCKSGTKRVHDPSCSIIPGRSSDSQDVSTSKKKRIVDDNNAGIHISSNGVQSSRFFSCLKRKPTLPPVEQDINNLLKKQKTTPAEGCIRGSKRPREEYSM